ncbi:hypothetical protein IWX90DRAFT_378335 [Phyllosticta citrichinensis]|uniref:Uncharacterized protein n=1 Tax=Phyllosticta citrichinensis TaxID=1130410 RepID=A0ABR1Y622_9PEZI
MSLSTQNTSSRPTTPSKRKKKSDPFEDLASAPLPSPLPSPDDTQKELDHSVSTLTKIILTPVLFTSFILSLFFVQRRDRAYRVAEHPPPASSWWSTFSPWQWLDPEPYQDPSDSTWQRECAGTAGGADGSIPGVEGRIEMTRRTKAKWFTRKKHRKMAKLHFTDAFDLQGKTIVAILLTWSVAFWGLYWSAKKLASMVW